MALWFTAGAQASSFESVVPCTGGETNEYGIYESGCDEHVARLPQAKLQTEVLPRVAQALTLGLGLSFIVVTLVAGSMLIMGYGEDETLQKARNAIVWGLTGIVMSFSGYFLVRSLLDLDIENTEIKSRLECSEYNRLRAFEEGRLTGEELDEAVSKLNLRTDFSCIASYKK